MGRFEIKHKIRKGQKFGRWKIVGPESRKAGIRLVRVRCQCGYVCDRVVMDLIQGRTTMCVECSKKSKFRKTYKGIGELSGAFLTSIRGRLVRKTQTLAFTVTKAYLWKLFLQQNRKCALSGKELVFRKNFKHYGGTASLDRIDSKKGYIEGNVQWVHKDINRMKLNFDQQYFIDTCKLIANHN